MSPPLHRQSRADACGAREELFGSSARAKLSEIVDEVEAGKEVEITRRGKKVALVISAARFARLKGDRVAFTAAYESSRQEHDLEQNGVEPNWAAELRDTDTGRRVRL